MDGYHVVQQTTEVKRYLLSFYHYYRKIPKALANKALSKGSFTVRVKHGFYAHNDLALKGAEKRA